MKKWGPSNPSGVIDVYVYAVLVYIQDPEEENLNNVHIGIFRQHGRRCTFQIRNLISKIFKCRPVLFSQGVT